jgi:hypothetical protein
VPDARRLQADIDPAWDAAERVLADRGFDIKRTDRTSGVIETGWLALNAEYSASVFLTENEDRYSDCGKPGLGRADRGKEARLLLRLLPAGRGQTDMDVRAAFRTERKAWFFGSSVRPDCQSRGRLEDEVFMDTQVKAWADQLHRQRRGWQ